MALRAAGRRDVGGNEKKWFAIIVGIIMLSSVVGFVFLFNPSIQGGAKFRHAGLTFEQAPQGIYTANIGGKHVDFFYRPEDVADVDMPAGITGKIVGSRALYITYYWNSSLAEEMALFQLDFSSLLDAQGVYAQPAFTTSSPLGASAVVTCGNATAFIPVLLLQEGVNNAVEDAPSSPHCIVLNATSSVSFLRTSDRLKYAVLEESAGK